MYSILIYEQNTFYWVLKQIIVYCLTNCWGFRLEKLVDFKHFVKFLKSNYVHFEWWTQQHIVSWIKIN